MDLNFYFSRFLGRLHWFLLIFVIGSIIGITLSRVLPTVYVAQATLVVESEQIPDELAASTVQTQAIEQLQIIQQRILTRDTLIEMANRLQIYAPGAGQTGNNTLTADEIVEDLRSRISIITTGGPARRGAAPQATLVSVAFEAPTAAMAAAVTNDVVTLILREDISMRTGVARQTLEFFEQEVTRLDRELAKRSSEILAFKEKNSDALPDSLEFRRTQQAAAQERLIQLEREQANLRESRARLVRLHDATGAINDETPARDQSPERRQLQALKDELRSALSLLSPENPKIKLMEAQIASLEKVVATQSAGATTDEAGNALSAYQVQLADFDGQIAYVEAQKADVQALIDKLQVSIDATPGNTVVLDTMQRDYSNTRAQYDETVAKKARAETGDTIEALAKGQRISVIEQAVAPREPSRPNRPLIALGGIAGGMALGAALVFLLEFLQGSIRRPADLTAALGITPFATLPYISTTRERGRRGLIRVVIWLLVALAIAGVLGAVHVYYQPLDLLLEQLWRKLRLS